MSRGRGVAPAEQREGFGNSTGPSVASEERISRWLSGRSVLEKQVVPMEKALSYVVLPEKGNMKDVREHCRPRQILVVPVRRRWDRSARERLAIGLVVSYAGTLVTGIEGDED